MLELVSVPFNVNGKVCPVRFANAVPPVAPAFVLLTATSNVKSDGVLALEGVVILILTFPLLQMIAGGGFERTNDGTGSTTTFAVCCGPTAQPLNNGVMVYVTVSGALVVLLNVPVLMLKGAVRFV